MTTEWSDDIDAGAWIGTRLSEFGSGRVDSVIPAGFAAYARVLHPVDLDRQADDLSSATRWADVAAWSGEPLTSSAQWVDIALPRHFGRGPRPWTGDGPAEGDLSRPVARPLATLGRRFTTTPEDCRFAVWDGWGDLHHRPDAPLLTLPNRHYFVYSGPAAAVLAVPGGTASPPSLWWPRDQAWCVATEIDLDRTYVGGSAELIAALLTDPHLEAQQVDPADVQICYRPPCWLEPLLDAAAEELATTGGVQLKVPLGTITARIVENYQPSPHRLSLADEDGQGSARIVRAGFDPQPAWPRALVVDSYGDRPGHLGGGSSLLEEGDLEPANLRTALGHAVLDLVR